jgi:aldose 1-epimerase
MSDVEVIANDHWRLGVLPGTGASVAFGQVKRGEDWLDLLRATPEERYGVPDDCASFVLAPWSNRLRDARFTFRGATYELPVNAPDGTAIHGVARDHAWRISDRDETSVVLDFDSAEAGAAFPWRFSTSVTYRLDGGTLTVDTTLTNCDEVPIPAGFGHHPYFRRGLDGSADEVELEVPCAQQYELERNLPAIDATPVPVEPRLDFRTLRPLGEVFIDDVLTGREPGAPVRMRYPDAGIAVTMAVDELYGDFVVYVPQEGKPFFAVEPVTNTNDGFNLFEAGTPGTGVFVLAPGESRSATFSLSVAELGPAALDLAALEKAALETAAFEKAARETAER